VARRQKAAKPVKKRLRRLRRLRFGRLGAIAAVVLVAYLYYRPLSSWTHTRAALAQRASQVQVLEAQKATLEREVEQATSLKQLARTARRIGLVRPGERLFIVKGIPEWRRTHLQPR
jgi:cell division protein FtsB